MKRWFVIILMLIGYCSFAQDVSFIASAPNLVKKAKQFRLTYTVNEQAEKFLAPELNNFTILAGPSTSTSSNVGIINGKVTQSFELKYTYIIEAIKEGTFTIPSAAVIVDGKKYTSNKVDIEVINGTTSQSKSKNSPELNQIVNYKQVDFKLPSTWNYKSQEIKSDYIYQISCWEKGGADSFTFQWFETESDLEEYLEIMKNSLKEQITHKKAVFSNNKVGNFQGNKTLYSTFSGELFDFNFSGKLIAFNNNGRTFLIIHQGDDEFYKDQTADKILSTLKVGFFKESTQLKTPDSWTLYEIENIGQLAVPPTLELRDDNSFIALATDIIHDSYVTHKKIEMTKSQLVFQPKGNNELDKEAFSKYARIIINYSKGEYGDFYKWNEKIELTDSEYNELDDYYKKEVLSLMTVMNVKLINWYPLEFDNINGLSYMKTSFTRQMGNNPIVKVDKYNFFNSNEAVEITLSYRLSESDIWKDDFEKVINYFGFKTKK